MSMEKWKYPKDYMGNDFSEYYILYGKNRDSDRLTRSNYDCIKEVVKSAESFSFNHWACGWIELLMIHESDKNGIEQGNKILAELADYPVYNDSHYSELEWNEMNDFWVQCSIKERVELCQKYNQNIFSARHDFIPDNCSIEEYLRSD